MEQVRSKDFETKQDLWNEAIIAGEFLCYLNEQAGEERFFGTKIDRSDSLDRIPDYRIHLAKTNKVVGYIEIRDRSTYSFDQIKNMGGLLLSTAKYNALCVATAKGFRVAFVVRFSDCIGYYSINDAAITAQGKHKSDRGFNETEPVVYFDPCDFQPINQTERQ
jgi:hypothetical protein